MRTVICVAWRGGDLDRERAWAWLRPRYTKLGWPIYEADSGDEPFSRAKSRNLAAREAGEWDVAVMLDADCMSENGPLHRAVDEVRDAPAVILPHDVYIPLNAGRTALLYQDEWHIRPNALYTPRHAPGGIVVVNRHAWDLLGGYDESFVGWGGEDNDLLTRAYALHLPVIRLHGTITHLWHTPADPRVH